MWGKKIVQHHIRRKALGCRLVCPGRVHKGKGNPVSVSVVMVMMRNRLVLHTWQSCRKTSRSFQSSMVYVLYAAHCERAIKQQFLSLIWICDVWLNDLYPSPVGLVRRSVTCLSRRCGQQLYKPLGLLGKHAGDELVRPTDSRWAKQAGVHLEHCGEEETHCDRQVLIKFI